MVKAGYYQLILLTIALAATLPNLYGQERAGLEDRRAMTALRMDSEESINLDGRLDEPVWKRAIPAADFIQIDPDNGAPPTEATEVYVVFDSNKMYMGVICHDSEPDQLKGNTMMRDAFLSADDRFMWVFDPYLDGRTGYFFEINPSGAMGDSLVGTGGGNERAWDGIWTAKIVRSDIGWVAEIEMPFRTLNFNPQGQAWGINFQRTVRRKSEESIWNGYARNQQLRTMSNAGLVVGLEGISQGVGLSIRPYVVGSAISAPGRGISGNTYKGDGGIDFIYNVTPKLRANFTVNTDFAETEVDDRQVNLTRFPLRFPEKREFFTEGSNYFSLSGYGDAFFSRRIGLNEGSPQRIDYGAKLTGQAGSQDIGVLQVRTAAEGSLLGEDFTVMRGRRRFLSDSHVGMLYTRRAAREADVIDPSRPATPDLHTMGFDFRMATRRFQTNKNLSVESHYVRTTNPRDTGKSGRYGIGIDYPNDLISANFRFNEDQANFDPAVGFIMRRGKDISSSFQFRPRPANHPWIRQFTFGVSYNATSDHKNLLLVRDIGLTLFQVNTHSGDSFNVGLTPQYELLDEDFRMQGGIVLPAGTEYRFTRYNLGGSMANSRPIALRFNFSGGNYYSGTRREFGPGIAIRPRNGLVLDVNGQWNRVELPGGSFSTAVFRTNISSQFSPWISIASNAQYDSVSRVLGWQARFRWILKPGNDIFFVYTHNWRNDSIGMTTVDRKAASKVVFTHRF